MDNLNNEDVEKRMAAYANGNLLQKRLLLGLIDQARIEQSKKDKLTEKTDKAFVEIMFDEGNAIIKYYSDSRKEYPFSFILNDKVSSTLYETLDLALLGYLGEKYEGRNSRFADYAWKLLKK